MASLDPELTDFIAETLPSVWAAELLVRLRHEPERSWTIEGLVRELRAGTRLVSELLHWFETAGLAQPVSEHEWRYGPASDQLDAICGRLEAAYRDRPTAVRHAILARADPLRGFADAFRVRRRPE